MRWRCIANVVVLLIGLMVAHQADHRSPRAPVLAARPVQLDDLGLLRHVQAKASRAAWRRPIVTEKHRNRVRRVVTPDPGQSSLRRLSAAWARTPFAILVANCESGGTPQGRVYDGDPFIKTNPAYRGRWQFSWATWATVGGHGDPADAPVWEQNERAYMLWKRDGWGQWQCAGEVG